MLVGTYKIGKSLLLKRFVEGLHRIRDPQNLNISLKRGGCLSKTFSPFICFGIEIQNVIFLCKYSFEWKVRPSY